MTTELVKKTAEMVKNKFGNETTGHDWWHIYRVWQTARKIAIEEKADLETVELAALLHDIADWKAYNGDLEVGPKKAREWLETNNAKPEIVKEICDIIKRSSFKGAGIKDEMPALEGKIVQDADRLDALGAIGIARVFTVGGHKGNLIHDPNQKPTFHQSFSEYSKMNGTSINHFYEKLLLLKDRMHTQTAKKIAEERHRFMEDFLERFCAEWDRNA